jgi:penicillin-binding protein 2
MTENRTRTRLRILAALVVFMFAALTTRLWFLQVLASEQFSHLADQNQVRLVPIEPLRGEILDRTGNVLVGNRSSNVVQVDRLAMVGREDEVLYRLSGLLKVPVQDMLDRLNSVKYLPYQPVPVAEDVPKEAIFYLEEHQDQFPGVSYQVGAIRDYPQHDLAAQILGYTAEISDTQLKELPFKGYKPGEIVGKAGVESTYERDLHGTAGIREIQVNAQGKVLNDDFNRGANPPVPGNNLVLSSDDTVQALAEQSLSAGITLARTIPDQNSGRYLRATAGAIVVMDPRNGQVLGMASNPSYDPSLFLGGLTKKEFAPLNDPANNYPLLNRAIQGLYPAGSTFKPFIAAGALKEKFGSMDGRYACPAAYEVPIDPTHHQFHNWNPVNQGFLTIPEALTVSCDTVFYQFGFDYWLKYFQSGKSDELMQRDLGDMGFGKLTGIDLPGEQPGRIPTADYEKKIYESNPKVYGKFYGWLPGDSVNLSIGQGYLTVTPMQLAMAYSAIANGGTLYQPHLGLRVQTPDGKVLRAIAPAKNGKLPISRKQVLFLRDSLKNVTTVGTAAAAFLGFPLSQIPVAGKTGTADIIPKQPYSWFAAMAPADNPKYVVVAMVEQGGHGSTTAAPIVRRVLEGLFGLGPGQLRAGSSVD